MVIQWKTTQNLRVYGSVLIVTPRLNINTLRPRQDGRHFADDIIMCIFFNENCCILNKFSMKYVRKGPIDNNPALVQIMAGRRSGDKPLSEPMMISLPTHIYMRHSASMSKYRFLCAWVPISIEVIMKSTAHIYIYIYMHIYIYCFPRP